MGNKSSKKHYKIPPNAARPDPPGKPEAETQKNGIYLRWACPKSNGNCPIIAYIVQHSELDEGGWHSSTPIPGNEALIHNLENGATYQFRVIAENLIGYSIPSPASEPILFSSAFALPRFITPLHSVSAIENEKVDFCVQVTGKPRPRLKWYLNGEEILSSNNLILDNQNQRLTIKCATSDLQGELTCSASNEVGIESSTAELTVGSPPRMLDDSSRETIFRVGEMLRIKFTFSGRPKPEVSWFHNGVLLEEDAVNIEVLANSSSLKIPHATRADRGEYTIQIENNLGTDTGAVLVTVADKPIPPCVPTVVLLRDNSCLLEWEEGSDDGGCPVQCYIVEYFRTGWDVWLTGATSRSKTAKIRDLIPGSRYRFRIKAENLYGLSDSSPESVELLIPDLSSGLMSTLPETDEEDTEKVAEEALSSTLVLPVKHIPVTETQISKDRKQESESDLFEDTLVKRPQTSSPRPYRDGLIFDHYQVPVRNQSRSPRRSPDSDMDTRRHLGHDQKTRNLSKEPSNLSKTCSLPREINNTQQSMTLSPRCSSVASSSTSLVSHLIYEGSSSSDDLDNSIVTCSSLTVLKSGSCQIKTSSGEELRTSTDNLGSRVTSSKNSLNSEDFDYYNSIFGKTCHNVEDEDEWTAKSPEDLDAEASEAAMLDSPEADRPSWFASWSWWMYFLVPVSLALFFKYILFANVCILLYVVYRLGMLFFE